MRAESYAALNGRPVQYLIDPRVDLSGPELRRWIVPLKRKMPADRVVTSVADGQ